MLKFLKYLLVWTVVMVFTLAVFALLDNFISWEWYWPWEWGKAGRFVIVIVGLIWAWGCIAVAGDE